MDGQWNYPETLTREMADDCHWACPVCMSLTDATEEITVEGNLFYAHRCSNCLRRILIEAKGVALDNNGNPLSLRDRATQEGSES